MLGGVEDSGGFAGSKEGPRKGFGREGGRSQISREQVHSGVGRRAFALQAVTSVRRSQDLVMAGPWRQLNPGCQREAQPLEP